MSSRLGRFRSVAILAGGIVLFVGAFQLAEMLVGPPEPRPQAERPETWDEPGEPIPIEIRRLGEQAYRIEVGGLHASTVRLSGEDDGSVDELVACVNAGIEQARQDGTLDDRPTQGFLARQAARHLLSEQLSSINSRCLQEQLALDAALPPLPPLPSAPGSAPESARDLEAS